MPHAAPAFDRSTRKLGPKTTDSGAHCPTQSRRSLARECSVRTQGCPRSIVGNSLGLLWAQRRGLSSGQPCREYLRDKKIGSGHHATVVRRAGGTAAAPTSPRATTSRWRRRFEHRRATGDIEVNTHRPGDATLIHPVRGTRASSQCGSSPRSSRLGVPTRRSPLEAPHTATSAAKRLRRTRGTVKGTESSNPTLSAM